MTPSPHTGPGPVLVPGSVVELVASVVELVPSVMVASVPVPVGTSVVLVGASVVPEVVGFVVLVCTSPVVSVCPVEPLSPVVLPSSPQPGSAINARPTTAPTTPFRVFILRHMRRSSQQSQVLHETQTIHKRGQRSACRRARASVHIRRRAKALP
jgi:hypothetical protein